MVVPFTIACGNCFFCKQELWSLCDNSNPNAWMAEKITGFSGSGLFGYSHMYGGYPGGQAEYARVPFADVGPLKVPDELSDEQVLFLSDIFPNGLYGGRELQHQAGRHHCGMGLWAGRSVRHPKRLSCSALSASSQSIRFAERLAMAATGKADTLNYDEVDVHEALRTLTGGQGPDACIDAVGLEAHGTTLDAWLRPGQGVDAARHGSLARAAAGYHGLPQGRHGLDSRRVR